MTLIKDFCVYYDADLRNPTPYSSENPYVKSAAPRIENTLTLVRNKLNGSAVLDIGASPFYFLYRCQLEGATKTAGVFYSEDAHPLRNENNAYTPFGELELAHIDALKEALPYPDNTFDVVSAMEIFEHFPKFPSYLLSEITRITKKQGIFLITVPNAHRAANIAKPILKKNVFMKYRNDPFGRHAHEYTKKQEKICYENLSRAKTRTFYPFLNAFLSEQGYCKQYQLPHLRIMPPRYGSAPLNCKGLSGPTK